MNKLGDGLMNFAGMLLITWLILEVFLNISVRAGWISKVESSDDYIPNSTLCPYFSQPCVAYDTIRGFRWASEGCRTLKTAFGKTIYDVEINANAQGYISRRDFNYPEDDLQHIVLLGDSYLDAYFLEAPWSSKMEDCMVERGQACRIYPYGINGGGIVNWGQVWEYELKPHAGEIDHVVLSIYGNDLDREFFMMEHTQDSAFLTWSPLASITEQPEFRNGLPVIRSSEFMDRLDAKRGWSFYLLPLIRSRLAEYQFNNEYGMEMEPYYQRFIFPDDQAVSHQFLHQKYGSKYDILLNLIREMRSYGIHVVIATVPELTGSTMNKNGSITQIQKELEFISHDLAVDYWDIYPDFGQLSQKRLNSAYLEYDGHFSQWGSDLYAKRMCGYMDLLLTQKEKWE